VLHVPRPPGQAELQRPGPGPPAEPDPLHPPAHPRRQPNIAHFSDSSHNHATIAPRCPSGLARLEVGGGDSHHAAIRPRSPLGLVGGVAHIRPPSPSPRERARPPPRGTPCSPPSPCP